MKNTNQWPLDEVTLQSSVSPTLTLIPGSNERELQLLRLGLVSGRGLSEEDTARLSGELPVAEIKLRAAEYIDKCHLRNKPGTVHEKSEALKKFFWYLETYG